MRRILAVSAAVAAGLMLTVSSTAAIAGGFAIREQSSLFLGTAFAGNAAGGTLSSMFWNSAATAGLPGMNTDSNYSAIILDAEVKVDSAVNNLGALQGNFDTESANSGDIAPLAIVSASYGNYQLSDQLYLGIGINAPFGLKTEPEDETYKGAVLARKTSLFTTNANPTIAYKVSPFLTLGAGLQIQYADAIFKFAATVPQANSATFSQDDWAVGATAGVMLHPSEATTIGLGWRSRMTHTFDGRLNRKASVVPPPGPPIAIAERSLGAEADMELPDVITLSLRQAVSPALRVMGTVEWTGWSRFEELRLVATEAGINPATELPVAGGDTVAVLEADWDDGWFFSLGGEYDYSEKTTLRAGIAYEISPVDGPEKRIVSIPDADRVWLSLGASYDYSASTTLDFAYTHIFVEDGPFERTSLGNPATMTAYTGEVEASADILSVGMRTKW